MIHIYFTKIDLGSTMTKVVIINRNEEICTRVIKHTGAEYRRLANKVMEEALEQAGLSFDEISCVIATGYGRITVPFADYIHGRPILSSLNYYLSDLIQ